MIFVTLVVTSLVHAEEETTTVGDESESYENDEPMYENEMMADEEVDDPKMRHHVKYVAAKAAPKKIVTKTVVTKIVPKKVVAKKVSAFCKCTEEHL